MTARHLEPRGGDSAGQTLLADAHAKVAKLKVAEKFPVRLPRISAFAPPAPRPSPSSRSSITRLSIGSGQHGE